MPRNFSAFRGRGAALRFDAGTAALPGASARLRLHAARGDRGRLMGLDAGELTVLTACAWAWLLMLMG